MITTDEIDLEPSMDELGLNFFKSAILNSNCFLEYGCGGSTSYAVRHAKVKSIISVDSSKEWIDKVNKSLITHQSRLFLKHCDIGEIGQWGYPTNKNRSQYFPQYMATPWEIAKTQNLLPDAILVDGRFRVACFLYSLLCSRVGTLIMFDDYLERPNYFVVERFCRLKERHGRMGVFIVEHQYSLADLVLTIAEYSHNPS